MITRSKAGIHKPKIYMTTIEPYCPTNIAEALNHPDWKHAATEEYNALISFGTWDLVPCPTNRKIVGCKWIFKNKTNAEGAPVKQKARLVAKGFSQEAGADYTDTFSPVVKASTIRILLTLAVSNKWKVTQLDFNNAFLNGDLMEEVFMQQPPGFEKTNPDPQGPMLVCKLKKALYGLKQAPRAWFLKLKCALCSLGFSQAKSDVCMFIRLVSNNVVYLLVYVDDLIITGSNNSDVQQLIDHMSELFQLKVLGELSYFLGIEFNHSSAGIHLSQKKYIMELLLKTHMEYSSVKPTPMAKGAQLAQVASPVYSDPTTYRSILGALQYICLTRPDIAFTVNKLAQYMQHPQLIHWEGVKRVLRYLNGTTSYGILIKPVPQLTIQSFADADWGSCKEDRRSTSGYCTFLGTNPIMWTSRKQAVVSRCTSEAEFRSVADSVSDVLWLLAVLKEMHITIIGTPTIWCDNSGTVAMAANPVLHSKSKHFELDLFFVREKVEDGTICVGYVPASEQVADVLTKALSAPMFEYCRKRLSVNPAT